MLDMCRDMEEVCPDVLFLNYTNPMAMLCWAMNRATAIQTVGLCHSVQGTAADIADWHRRPRRGDQLPLRRASTTWPSICASSATAKTSIPHCAQLAAERREPAWDRVRFEMLRRFGYFVTESSEHFSEYVPWFIKPGRADLIEQFNIPLDEYPARCEDQIADWGEMRAAPDLARSGGAGPLPGGTTRPAAAAWTSGASRSSKKKTPPCAASMRARSARRARKTTQSGSLRRVRDADHPQCRDRPAAAWSTAT